MAKNRKYPRLHNKWKFKHKDKMECECCTEIATGKVCVEFTYMRGEDEDYRVCDHHYQMATDNFDQFLKDADAKYKASRVTHD